MSISQTTTIETVKYSTQLPPDQIKWAKLYALSNDIKHDYEVMSTALTVLKTIDALPVDQLPSEVVSLLDDLKAGKQETLFT